MDTTKSTNRFKVRRTNKQPNKPQIPLPLTRNLPRLVIQITSTPSLQYSSIPHHLRSFPFGPSSSISVHTPSPLCVMALSSFDSVIKSSSLRALSTHSQSLRSFAMSNLASLSLRTLGLKNSRASLAPSGLGRLCGQLRSRAGLMPYTLLA